MNKRLVFLLGHMLVVLGMLGSLWQPAPVEAAGFTVTSVVDTGDTNPGDGVCRAPDGSCTLRAAIQEANAQSGADTITLPAGRYMGVSRSTCKNLQ